MWGQQPKNLVQFVILTIQPGFHPIHPRLQPGFHPSHGFRTFVTLGEYLRRLFTQAFAHLRLHASNLGDLCLDGVQFGNQERLHRLLHVIR
jgi:hypothetical protein